MMIMRRRDNLPTSSPQKSNDKKRGRASKEAVRGEGQERDEVPRFLRPATDERPLRSERTRPLISKNVPSPDRRREFLMWRRLPGAVMT